MKKLLCILLSILMLIGLLPVAALADEPETQGAPADNPAEPEILTDSIVYVNPLYADLFTPEDIAATQGAPRRDAPAVATTVEAASALLRAGMKARQGTITFILQRPYNEIVSNNTIQVPWKAILQGAMAITADGQEGDYLRWSYGGYTSGASGQFADANAHGETDAFNATLTYTVRYLNYDSADANAAPYMDAAEMETAMKTAADAALASLGFTADTTAYQKLCAIYDYIASVTYYTASANIPLPIYHTAYSAICGSDGTVCQGYATLLYYMLKTAGVPCRIVAGLGNGGSHAWNMVQMDDGLWYSVDLTWDDDGNTAERNVVNTRKKRFRDKTGNRCSTTLCGLSHFCIN